MNITMTITADTPTELFSTIKGCAALLVDDIPTAVPEGKTQAPNPQPTNPTPAPAVTPVNITPAVVPSGQGIAGPVPTQTPPAGQMAPVTPPPAPNTAVPLASAPTYSTDQIAKAGAELAQAGKMNDLLMLLQQYGVQAITELRPEQLGPFATALRGLGANL